jgi:TolB-like protein/DNA-binding winged helix-turn-helix (wHTH) protein/tetratricopeptide (TPR) repeat protein
VVDVRITEQLPHMRAPGTQFVRFALFEVDFRAGELSKEGRRIRLQEQPLQVLGMLVERPGEVVTREELKQRLWPADTFVDFDHGLNSAVARLREALNDSADSPKFVETVARRGYRFIGHLETAVLPPAVVSEASRPDNPALQLQPASSSWRKWLPALVGLGLIVLVSAVSFLLRPAQRSQALSKPMDSVAVLPFENASATSDSNYLADGITQSAIDHLSRLPNLKVISMGSVLRYRGRQGDVKQIGRDLGVRSVMVGKIDFRGERMVVMAELIDASDGTHIWGEQYDRKVTDIMAVQEDITREIAKKLEVRLSTQQENMLRKRYTQDFEAYEIYLRGRYYWDRRTQEDLQRGLAYFQQAIDRDPTNALAYAGLADSYFVKAISGALPAADAMPKAKAAALKALEIDNTLAEAHTSLAQITANYEWNWDKAEMEYRKAIELNPNSSTGHHYFGTFLMGMGRHAEALEEMKRAQELDPLSPIIATFIGKAFDYAAKNDEAIQQYEKVLASDPSFPVARTFLLRSLEQAGRLEEAIAQAKIVASQAGSSTDRAEAVEAAYRTAGPTGYWKEILRQQATGKSRGPDSDLDIAGIYVKLGDQDSTFRLLDRAYTARNMWLMNLKVDPRWDTLRSDPRFESLLLRVGLATRSEAQTR